MNEIENTQAVLLTEAELALEVIASYKKKIAEAQQQTQAAIDNLKKQLNQAEGNNLALRAQDLLIDGITKSLQQTFNKDKNEPTTSN